MLKKLLCFILLATPAHAADGIAHVCDIKIEFGSFTTAIDAVTYEKIMDKAQTLPAITEKHIENLQPTGQRTLCLTVPDETQLADTYDALRALLPDESKPGWEEITARNGSHFKTEESKVFVRPKM